jgi:hypothetical protein
MLVAQGFADREQAVAWRKKGGSQKLQGSAECSLRPLNQLYLNGRKPAIDVRTFVLPPSEKTLPPGVRSVGRHHAARISGLRWLPQTQMALRRLEIG